MDGEGPTYASAALLSEVSTQSSLVLTLKNCDNCAICIGFTSIHPVLEPFNTNLNEMVDCSGIVGHIAAEDGENVTEKTYNTQVVVPIS